MPYQSVYIFNLTSYKTLGYCLGYKSLDLSLKIVEDVVVLQTDFPELSLTTKANYYVALFCASFCL